MRLAGAKYYTTLDIRGAYNLVRMAEGEEWKTAFRTQYGLFESLVMPFGLCNAPSDFQALINDVLRPYLDVFCTAYLDDILIYSDNLIEHKAQVRQVLSALRKAGLHLQPEKCKFHQTEVKYLGLIITRNGPSQGIHNPRMAYTKNCEERSIIPGICQFLPSLHQGLLVGGSSAYWVNQERKGHW